MNCVVICCDTFRADMIGHPVVRTPNLDRLRAEGIEFPHAFAEALPTIQARRTCFTGARSFPWSIEMGSRGLTPAGPGWHRVPDDQTVLAEHLLTAGVVTGLVADTYHMFKPTQNFTRGFCSWNFIRGQEGDPVRSGPISAVDVSPYHPEGLNDLRAWPTLTQYLLNMLDRHTEEDYLTPRVFRAAQRWLDENRDNAPWFLWIDSFAPHERWDPPMEFADTYCPPGKSRNYIQPQLLNGKKDKTPDEIDRTRALYYGYVTFVDKWIGRFLDKLRQMGRLEDTAVIFTSDHGTELMDRDRFGKGGDRLVAYNTRLPWIVRLPGGRHGGTKRDDFVQHFDLFPTVCGLMGASTEGVEQALAGRDLFDERAAAPDRVITAWARFVSIRDRQWNLVLDSTAPDRPGRLCDLTEDPAETHDVLPDHPDAAAALRRRLEADLGPMPYAVRHTGDRRQAPPLWWRFRE
jgi:arylsulfatase A-like enzyme